MATLATTHPTLLDLANMLAPNGQIAGVAEIMAQENPILEDMVMVEGNLANGHLSVIRTGYATPTWRKIYGGVQPSKGRTAAVTDTCGMLEDYGEVDVKVADMNGNTADFMLKANRTHIEGIANELASTVFYGDEKTEEATFTGLSPRFNDLSAENAENIVDAGGTGSDNASAWLVVWSDTTAHGIVPKGSKAGLSVQDKGQVTIENIDGQGGRMEAYRTHYKQEIGMTVVDWNYVARVCNIDVSALTVDGTAADRANAQKDLITYMIMASERVKSTTRGRACWYVSKRIREVLRLGILEKVANNLSWESVTGKRVMTFDDVPVKRCDALMLNEARVV